jgi:hypothetical protein
MPTEVVDNADDARDRITDDEPNLFRIEPLSERGRSDEVGEKRRYDPAFLPDVGTLLHHALSAGSWSPCP